MCISAFGGLIPNNVRGTIDSITYTCLSTMYSVGSKSVFSYSQVKKSLLQLGMNSVCMPWGDGGRSALLGMVRIVASMLRRDLDVTVASSALSTLCALDAIITPRAPALYIPSREVMSDVPNTLSADEIIEGIKTSAVETKTERKATKPIKKKTLERDEYKSKEVKSSTNSSVKGQKDPIKTADNVSGPIMTEHNNLQSLAKFDDGNNIIGDTKKPGELVVKTDKAVTANTTEIIDNSVHIDLVGVKDSEDRETMKSTTIAQELDKTGSSDDDSSMEDFPDIIDEGPDEEDKIEI